MMPVGLQILCALVYGKKEDGGGFEITQTLVADTVTQLKENLTGDMVPLFPTLPAHYLRPLVHLCISGASVFVEPSTPLC